MILFLNKITVGRGRKNAARGNFISQQNGERTDLKPLAHVRKVKPDATRAARILETALGHALGEAYSVNARVNISAMNRYRLRHPRRAWSQ